MFSADFGITLSHVNRGTNVDVFGMGGEERGKNGSAILMIGFVVDHRWNTLILMAYCSTVEHFFLYFWFSHNGKICIFFLNKNIWNAIKSPGQIIEINRNQIMQINIEMRNDQHGMKEKISRNNLFYFTLQKSHTNTRKLTKTYLQLECGWFFSYLSLFFRFIWKSLIHLNDFFELKELRNFMTYENEMIANSDSLSYKTFTILKKKQQQQQ